MQQQQSPQIKVDVCQSCKKVDNRDRDRERDSDSKSNSKHECVGDAVFFSKIKQACVKVFQLTVKKVFAVFFSSKV